MEWLDQLIEHITQNAEQAPALIFGVMAMSGFNLPIRNL